MSLNFDNKVVLITGASSGIGESAALLFAKLGAKLAITGRDEDRTANVAKKCKELSPHNFEALQIIASVSLEEDVDRIMDEVIKHYNQLDVLVNNAAKGGGGDDRSLKMFDLYVNTNVRSIYQLCHRALPLLEKSKGSIVNISSINGIKPFNGMVTYCVVKAALDMLTRCLAQEWAPKGIRVNGINPAQIDTPVWNRPESSSMNPKQVEVMWRAVDAKYPIRRRGYPDDIANAIAFLASDLSGFITGVNLLVDGGFMDSAQLVLE